MKDHLPECQRWYANMPEPDECPACEMFRACEQRARDAAREAVLAVAHKHGIASDAPVVLEFLAGIDALREKP